MKKLSTKWFNMWSKKVNLANDALLVAISDLKGGLSTTDLGTHCSKFELIENIAEKAQGLVQLLYINKVRKQYSYMDLDRTKKRILTKLNYNISRN